MDAGVGFEARAGEVLGWGMDQGLGGVREKASTLFSLSLVASSGEVLTIIQLRYHVNDVVNRF